MIDSNTPIEKPIDDQLIEEISQLESFSLGEGAATCQVCGSSFQEGDSVVVYVFRPAGEVMSEVGWVVCDDEEHELPREFTLGVRELIVEGCVGCDAGEEAMLIEPEVVGASAAATKSMRLLPEGTGSAGLEAGASREPDDAVESRLFGGEQQ